MRPFFLIAGLLLLTLITLAGHLYGSTNSNRVSARSEIAHRDYNITLTRTGCYGDCPIYTLHLDGRGYTRLVLEGLPKDDDQKADLVHFVYESKIPNDRRDAIISLAEKGGFRTLNLDYSRGNPDLERRAITIATKHGNWSTSVYGIPCESAARKWKDEHSSDDIATVPDVFCALESELHQVACETLAHGARVDRVRGADPIQPPTCGS